MFISLLKRKNLNIWYVVGSISVAMHTILVMFLFFVMLHKPDSIIHLSEHYYPLIFMPYKPARRHQEKQLIAQKPTSKKPKQEKKKTVLVPKKNKEIPSPKKQIPVLSEKNKITPVPEEPKKQEAPKKAEPPAKVEPKKQIPQEEIKPHEQETTEEPLIVGTTEHLLAKADVVIRDQILQQWHPPQGFGKLYCRFKIVMSKEGVPTSIDLEESSGVPAYDIAARTALMNIAYPREKWSSTLIIAFGELLS